MPHINNAFATVNGGFAPGLAKCVVMVVYLVLVLAYLIVVFYLFVNFTMNWLDPFSVICMVKSGVKVTTILHKDAVDSFRFFIHWVDFVCWFFLSLLSVQSPLLVCSSLLSVRFCPFFFPVVVKHTISSLQFSRCS